MGLGSDPIGLAKHGGFEMEGTAQRAAAYTKPHEDRDRRGPQRGDRASSPGIGEGEDRERERLRSPTPEIGESAVETNGAGREAPTEATTSTSRDMWAGELRGMGSVQEQIEFATKQIEMTRRQMAGSAEARWGNYAQKFELQRRARTMETDQQSNLPCRCCK